ncbi:MAG: tetratricopeptide repeat protein [Leptospiraceae bacterium]|nr:tetratricopeptide repeat protein [Leptospiraceae bacterium]
MRSGSQPFFFAILFTLLTGLPVAIGAEIPEYASALEKYKAGQYEESLNIIRSVFDANRQSMELRMLAAANYMEQGNYASAREHLNYCITDHPREWQPRVLLSALQRRQQQYAGAVQVARRAIQLTSDKLELRLEIAAALLESRNPKAAQPHLARALELDPSSFHAQYLDGLTWLMLGNNENAELRFRSAMELPVPGKSALANLYANLAYAMEQQITPALMQNRKNHAVLRLEEASQYCQKALALAPEHVIANQNLKRIQARLAD